MTIYKNTLDHKGNPKSETPLIPGPLTLENAGTSIQVQITPTDEITVFPRTFKGHLVDLHIEGFGSELTPGAVGLKSMITAVTLQPEENTTALELLGVHERSSTILSLTRGAPSTRERLG